MERHLIIEVLGTGGAGKTTLEPLLADLLDVPLFAGGKRQSIEGRDLTPVEVWSRRVVTIGREPGLFVAGARSVPTTVRNRLWFAMDICRRQENARRAAVAGAGVVASGPLHALGQGSARFGTNLEPLVEKIRTANVYVFLDLPAELAAERLAARRQVAIERVGDHVRWTERYVEVVRAAALRAGAPLIEVDARGEPTAMAGEAARGVRALGA